MTVDELQVLITANTTQLRSEINKANQQIASMQKQTTKTSNAVVKGFGFIKTGIIALGIGKLITSIFSNLDGAVSRVDTLNNYANVMSNLGISSDDAEASINRLSDKLQGLPTTLDNAASSVQQFTSANGNVKASTEMFLALNNAILAGGASTQTQASAIEQLSQAYAKGKPDMMEWRALMTAMPAQLKQVAIAMGYASADQLGENLRNGKVSMNDFMKTIIELNKNGANGFQSFEEQARNSTGGIGTSIANMKTAFTRGMADIMNAIGQSNIASFFQGIANIINKVIPYIVAFVKVCAQAVSYVSKLFGGKSTKKSADDTSKSLKNLGSSGTSTASGLDDASSSAKKLKKELNGLAGFDEMNVLQENTGSDSGSGSGFGGVGDLGDIDLSGFDDLEEKSSKADEIAEKMKKAFQGVGEILKTIWDSEPVQAYVKVMKAQFNFLKDLVVRLGIDLWNNMVMTWKNIEDNVKITLSNISSLLTNIWTDMADGINTWGPVLIDGISKLFNSIWKDAIDPALQLITKYWADFSKILLDKWNEYGKPLIDNIGEFAKKTIDLFQSIWDNVIKPIIEPFLENFKWLWDNHLKGMIESLIDFIGKLVNGTLEIYNKFIEPLVSFLLKVLSPAWTQFSNLVIGVFSTVVAYISDHIKSIMTILGGIIDFITGVFTGNWKKAWQGVVSIFQGIVSGIAGIIKLPINLIIDGINSFIAGLNKIKIPDWVPGVGGKGFNISKIPKLAQGGIVDKPTYAMIGEAGKEAVMPLERNTGWIDQLADKLGSRIGNNDTPQRIVINLGNEKLVDTVIDGVNDKAFETNGEVVFNL